MITQPLFLGLVSFYSILLTSSAVIGLGISSWMTGERKKFYLDVGIGLLFLSLLGARIGYVIRNMAYFTDHVPQIPQIWLGGISWPGALIGAGAALVGIHLIWKEPLGELADSYLPLLGVVTIAIWLTGWGAGIGFGPITDAWFGIPVQDLFGITENRWPLPILGAALSGGWIAGLVLIPQNRWSPKSGCRGILGITGIVLINGVVSLFRVNPAPILGGLRGETWFSLLVLGSIGGLYFRNRKTANEQADS